MLTLAGVFVARTALAKISMNTIDPVGIVAHNGRHVTVTGPLAITAGEQAQMRVPVTQRTTGAVAEGQAILTGTGAKARLGTARKGTTPRLKPSTCRS